MSDDIDGSYRRKRINAPKSSFTLTRSSYPLSTMRFSQLALLVAPLISVATAAVPNAAALGNLAKRDAPQCSLQLGQTCDLSISGECCNSDCKKTEAGATCGGCYWMLEESCDPSVKNGCCEGKCVRNVLGTGTCEVSCCQSSHCAMQPLTSIRNRIDRLALSNVCDFFGGDS
ncbi:hypothetical protein J3A83DRAFT_4220463 [Scleroderma citrinum]